MVQNKIWQTIGKCNKESYALESKMGQNALNRSRDFEQAKVIMGDTIEDMDLEVEQKGNKVELLENKICLPDSKGIEEMNKLRLNEIQIRRKSDRIMDRLNNSLINHKYKKKQKN